MGWAITLAGAAGAQASTPGAAAVVAASADPQAAQCKLLSQSAERLRCYDQAFGAANPAPVAAASDVPVGSADPAQVKAVDAPPRALTVADAMDALWELKPETRRRRFVVRTYQPNYLMPVRYTTSVNRSPSTPTRGALARQDHYQNAEVALQISLRSRVASDLLFNDDSLWFAYTQKSVWQLWDRHDSAPFRNTDYQPEVIYTTPVSARWGTLPGGWRLHMAQLAFSHQSNGQSDPLSRSWNRVWGSLGFQRGEFAVFVQPSRRLPESKADDDNPDLTGYAGSLELRAAWFPGRASAQVTTRISRQGWSRGSWQFDWSVPVQDGEVTGLRWYAQLFTGYGETLLDYNHRQTSIGLGVMLFQF